MFLVYKFDENRFFLETKPINDYSDLPENEDLEITFGKDENGEKYPLKPEYTLPPNYTEIMPPNFYNARFDIEKQEWFEFATAEEIAEILKPQSYEPTTEDILLDLDFRMTILELGVF